MYAREIDAILQILKKKYFTIVMHKILFLVSGSNKNFLNLVHNYEITIRNLNVFSLHFKQ